MVMAEYRYCLVRYVPDFQRMEPTNVGVILQGSGRIEIKISPHAAKRKEIDTPVFQQWKKFLNDEINGPAVPLFQPRRNSPDFLRYLGKLCEGSVFLSEPLYHRAADALSFDDVLQTLYQRLVAPPEAPSASDNSRPTAFFRHLSDDRQFLKRGMKRHTHVATNGEKLWMAYRQVDNGAFIAIDKIEVNTQIGATANEIERMPLIVDSLPKFLRGATPSKHRQFFLLADELERPFAEQPEDEFEAMRKDLEQAVERVEKRGGRVIRSIEDAGELVNEVEQHLAPLPGEIP
jgi:hypothetical protein